jgi:hypothetical protein
LEELNQKDDEDEVSSSELDDEFKPVPKFKPTQTQGDKHADLRMRRSLSDNIFTKREGLLFV